jgi:hypothetical protein
MLATCTTEEVTSVDVASVDVLPEDVTAVQGDRVQLVATVRGDDDEELPSAEVQWTSSNSSIASVDANGLVEALVPGSATISASYQGVSGSTSVSVLTGPYIEVIPGSVAMVASLAFPSPSSVVEVRSGGAGSAGALSVQVINGAGQPNGWLSAQLANTSAPTQLTLTVRSDGLAPGAYEADVRVATLEAGDATVAVQLDVQALQPSRLVVTETNGSTVVSEQGTTDTFLIALTSRPSSTVVVSVTSGNLLEVAVASGSPLAFTSANWSNAQLVVVRGVPDLFADGTRSVEVTARVVDLASDPQYRGQTARVTVQNTEN